MPTLPRESAPPWGGRLSRPFKKKGLTGPHSYYHKPFLASISPYRLYITTTSCILGNSPALDGLADPIASLEKFLRILENIQLCNTLQRPTIPGSGLEWHAISTCLLGT